MKITGLLAIVVLVSTMSCNTTGTVASSNNSNAVKYDVNITMPKYFFTDEINKSCKMAKAGEANSSYSNSLFANHDLTEPGVYKWLEDLINYNWKEDHAKRSDSLTVYFKQLTDRMEYINTALTNSIIDGTIETQANKAIDLIVTFAEADYIMDSTTVQEIQNMRANGTFTRCYNGKGKESASCHWHTAQEAARYSGQIAIIANLAKPYMNDKELTITENYLDALYTDYIKPWFYSSGSGDTDGKGFYQMGHGGISMLAYAHWKNRKDIAEDTFNDTFKYIDYAIFDQGGYINNNSFRGVRGYWYHSSGLNNMLGMVALAEEYQYPVDDKIYNKLTDAVEFLNQDAVDYLAWLESLPRHQSLKGDIYTFINGKDIYIGNSSWKHQNSRNYIHQEAVFLTEMAETYTKAFLNKDSKEYKIYKYKGRNKINDQQLGFNPTCITR